MRKILEIVLAITFLLACNAGNDKQEDKGLKHEHEHELKETGLVLNNGVKWKADSITIANVALLQSIVSHTKKERLEDYLQSATALQKGLDKMVSECKMKGAAHEALHHWLVPLMKETKALTQANTTENAAALFYEVEKTISLFSQYFE